MSGLIQVAWGQRTDHWFSQHQLLLQALSHEVCALVHAEEVAHEGTGCTGV